MKDYIIRGIDQDRNFRLFALSTTNLVEEARLIHNTSPTATAALGRALTAAVMMGIDMKSPTDSLTFQIKGDGPIGRIVTVANNKGEVKGYADNPQADLASRPDGKLDVGGLVGRNGQMSIIRDLGLKEPYLGMANLVSGEIAEDLVQYFHISEQQPSAINLGVLVDKDISVKAAGGYMLQILPNADDTAIDRLEEILKTAKPISSLIDSCSSIEEAVEELFGDFNIEILEKHPVTLKCDCDRERIESVLISLGEQELAAIIEEDGQAEVVCHFCNTNYTFNKEELEEILNSLN